MPTSSSSGLVWILIALIVLSLVLNAVIIVYGLRIRGQFLQLRTTVHRMLSEAVVDLQRIENLTLHFNVRVKDTILVSAEVPVREEMEVDVQGNIPVKQTITTDVRVNAGPLGFRVPMNVSVPIDIKVPVALQVPVLVDSTIPVSVEVPIDLIVPVPVDLGQTELGAFIEQVRENLYTLEGIVGDVSFDEMPPPSE